MRATFLFVLVVLGCGGTPAPGPVPTPSPAPGKIAPSPGHVYVGAWADPALGSQPAAIASLEGVLGHKLALHTSYWGFNAGTQLATIQGNAAIQDDVKNGRIPLISWGCSSSQGNTFADIASGKTDQVVIDAAAAVKALGVPVFIRPSWEFNINVNNPAGNPNGNNCYSAANVGNVAAQAGEFIAYFRHLVTVFNQQGATNATWVFCPVASTEAFSATSIDSFYPGDAYVDWIAGDTYDKTSQPVRGFVGIWKTFWDHYKASGKPLLIGETGEYNNATDNFTQQKFFTDAAAALQPGGAFYASESSRIDAIAYFDSQPGGSGINWTVDSPQDAGGESAWRAMMANPFFH